jgi:hypothetical protein
VLEAGIEEALTHIHEDGANLTANQWTADQVNGQPVYWKHRTFPDGSYFNVTNFGVDTDSPIIHSAGYVPSPLKSSEYINRIVEVGTTNPPSLFFRAIAANGSITLSGGAIVDGYNSTNGWYDPVTNRTANGGVATNSKDTGAINVGTAHVFGDAVTGDGGTITISGGGVGDVDWNLNHTGIEPGWTNNNMYVNFQPNTPPSGPFLPASANGTNFLLTGTYVMDSVNINSASKPMIVTGNAVLWVKGNFVVSGVAPNAGYVFIAPGASLKLYVAGTTTSISGGGIVNGTGLPSNFSYYGLPTNKSVNYSGSANFVGTINAPQAAFNISGGSSVFGAVICDSFSSSGGSSVHYDQAAGSKGIFLVTSWREL